jgi:glycosyltransferase involved in cell wall biosynthesis
MAKLLYICPFIPYPLNTGGNQAFFMMADNVRKYHDLSMLLYVHHKDDRKNLEELKRLWPDVTFYAYDKETEKEFLGENPELALSYGMSRKDKAQMHTYNFILHSMQRKVSRKRRKYEAIQDDMVRSNSTLFMENLDLTAPFCSYVQYVCEQHFDIIQVEFYEYLPIVYALPKDSKKVFVHHELRFVRNEIEINLFHKLLPTDIISLESKKAKELAALSAYDAVITLTDTDRDILKQYLPEDKLFTSPAITQLVSVEHMPFKPVKDIAFVGNSIHFPNVDGILWFCKEVLPCLRSKGVQIPTIYVTGNWDKKIMEELSALCPEITFVGFINDLQSFLNGKLSIVPIRIGSGMRMKLIDTACAAAPIVTTSKGCEGLPFVHEENCLMADTPEDFADAIARLLSDEDLQRHLAVNAQDLHTEMLNEDELLHKRMNVYDHIG